MRKGSPGDHTPHIYSHPVPGAIPIKATKRSDPPCDVDSICEIIREGSLSFPPDSCEIREQTKDAPETDVITHHLFLLDKVHILDIKTIDINTDIS